MDDCPHTSSRRDNACLPLEERLRDAPCPHCPRLLAHPSTASLQRTTMLPLCPLLFALEVNIGRAGTLPMFRGLQTSPRRLLLGRQQCLPRSHKDAQRPLGVREAGLQCTRGQSHSRQTNGAKLQQKHRRGKPYVVCARAPSPRNPAFLLLRVTLLMITPAAGRPSITIKYQRAAFKPHWQPWPRWKRSAEVKSSTSQRRRDSLVRRSTPSRLAPLEGKQTCPPPRRLWARLSCHQSSCESDKRRLRLWRTSLGLGYAKGPLRTSEGAPRMLGVATPLLATATRQRAPRRLRLFNEGASNARSGMQRTGRAWRWRLPMLWRTTRPRIQ